MVVADSHVSQLVIAPVFFPLCYPAAWMVSHIRQRCIKSAWALLCIISSLPATLQVADSFGGCQESLYLLCLSACF